MQKVEANYLIVIRDEDVLKDFSPLISLYEPIIGAHALALYLSLINEAYNLKQLNYPKFEISRLYKISALTEKNFHEAIKKLESLRLVKTKISRKTGVKKYEIFSCLEPNEFFENELFEKALAAKIGSENIEALKFLFKEKGDLESDDEFEDVTALFEDVFAAELTQIAMTPKTGGVEFNNLRTSKKTILEKMLNLNLLTALLKEQKIVLNYNSQKLKKTLNWAVSIFNFNEETLAQLIIESFDNEKNKLNLKTFENKVQVLVFTKKNATTVIPTKKVKTFFDPIAELNEMQIFEAEQMNRHQPELIIQKLTNRQPDLATRRMINTLRTDYNLEFGAINYLIEFSCFKNNNRVVANYIYKIADSLKEFEIFQTTDVMIYLQQLKQYNSQKKTEVQENKLNQKINFVGPIQPLSHDEIVKLATEI